MPQHASLSINATWTLVTDTNVSAVTLVNHNTHPISILATANTSAPAESEKGVPLLPGFGIGAQTPLANIFPGITPVRLWARSPGVTPASVYISHA